MALLAGWEQLHMELVQYFEFGRLVAMVLKVRGIGNYLVGLHGPGTIILKL